MKKIQVNYADIDKYYIVGDDGRVTAKYPGVAIEIVDLPHSSADEDNEDEKFKDEDDEDEEFKELDAFFDGALSELRRGEWYGRWASYQLIHKDIWLRDWGRSNHIKQTFIAMRRRVRLLANPVVDTASFLRSEHAKTLLLFDQLGSWADIAFTYSRRSAADYILTKVWHKGEPPVLPFGELWTVDELQGSPQSNWPDDDVWTWKEFWAKANPMLREYYKAIDYLATIRLLQHYIRRCEIDPTAGFQYFTRQTSQQNCDQKKRSEPKESKPVESEKLETVESDPSPRQKKGRQPESLYKSFSELFTDPESEAVCIRALEENDGEYTILNIDGEWIGKRGSVSVLHAWLEQLQYYKKIKTIPKLELILLLNKRFPGLKLGERGRHFGNSNDILPHYKAHFRAIFLK